MPITENDLSRVYDGDVLSASGEKIGSVGQIYLDDQTGEPTFVTANTGLFGMSQSFVPLRGARVENGDVIVDFDKTTVKDAPRIDDDGSLSPAEEDQLYAYYGMSATSADVADYGTDSQTPEPGYATTDRNEAMAGQWGGRGDVHEPTSPGGRDSRSENWGDRPAQADERGAAAGTTSEGAGIAREGSGGFGALESAGRSGDDKLTPDAPLADRRRTDPDQGSDENMVPPATDESPRTGRLRKWVMTEYEPVNRGEVYVEGQGRPGERTTR